MKDKHISLAKESGKRLPDRNTQNYLVSIAQVTKTILISVPADTASRKLLLHLCESLLMKIAEYTISFIENLERVEDEKAN